MLPGEVRDLADRYLDAIDEALPGFVTALYIVGSAALGAWQPGHSDVDTVILTSRPFSDADLAAVAGVHAAMPVATKFDGVYLDPAAFAERPMDQRVVPFVVNGEFQTAKPCGELNPVVWLNLLRYGIPLRGQPVDGPLDRAALEAYNRENLKSYWQPLAAQVRAQFAAVPGDLPVEADWVVWLITGPARLHYTIATGDIISKSDVADYIAAEFPAWADLARRAVAWRRGEPAEFTAADLLDAANHVEAVVSA